MSDEPTSQAIGTWVRDVMGWDGQPEVVRLDGGYSWQTHRVSNGGSPVIARVAPLGGTVEPYDPRAEAAALGTASEAGLPVTSVLAIDDGDRLGRPAAIHTFLDGQVVRPSTQTDDRDAYRTTFASTLGLLHRSVEADEMTIRESYMRTIDVEMDHYRRTAPCAHPGFEIAWQWLLANLPDDDRPAVFLHGDYRLANLLWTGPGELSGVLDWERARSGDPMCDVAFTRLFSGWCAIEGDAETIYTDRSGIEIDEDRIAYATVFERWRSFTSAMRGLAAFVDGRNSDRRLIRIGLAGEAGAWRFVDELTVAARWSEDGLPNGQYSSAVVDEAGPTWPALHDADQKALDRSLRALDDLPNVAIHGLPPGGHGDSPDVAYRVAHMGATMGLRLGRIDRALLQALALRATLRFGLLEEHGWH